MVNKRDCKSGDKPGAEYGKNCKTLAKIKNKRTKDWKNKSMVE